MRSLSVSPKWYSKLFYDLQSAQLFGAEVDSVAQQTMIPTGKKRTTYQPIFRGAAVDPNSFENGIHYNIYTEQNTGNTRTTYYVRYTTDLPSKALRSDRIVAEREAASKLDQKYAELGPSVGHGYSVT
jgi:hypothetical protein